MPSSLALRRFRLRLLAGLVAINLLVMAMGAASLRRSRAHHQAMATVTTQNLAMVLDQYLAVTFSKADLALLTVKDEVERGASGPELDQLMELQQARIPSLDSLRLADARGQVEHGTGVMPGTPISIADRDYFLRLVADPACGLVISEPIVGRISGKPVLVLARALTGPDGRFMGAVYGVVALEAINRTFAALDVGTSGSVSIRDGNLGLLARYPPPEKTGSYLGDRHVSPQLAGPILARRVSGTWLATSALDQVERAFAYRRVADLPLYVVVGLASRDFLVGWWREVWSTAAWIIAFAGVTSLSAAGFHGAWRRQREAIETQAQLLAEVKTLGGMLPICSHCKKIRDDSGYWNQLEAFIHEHTDASFTHGICPDCARTFFPETRGKAQR